MQDESGPTRATIQPGFPIYQVVDLSYIEGSSSCLPGRSENTQDHSPTLFYEMDSFKITSVCIFVVWTKKVH